MHMFTQSKIISLPPPQDSWPPRVKCENRLDGKEFTWGEKKREREKSYRPQLKKNPLYAPGDEEKL